MTDLERLTRMREYLKDARNNGAINLVVWLDDWEWLIKIAETVIADERAKIVTRSGDNILTTYLDDIFKREELTK